MKKKEEKNAQFEICLQGNFNYKANLCLLYLYFWTF